MGYLDEVLYGKKRDGEHGGGTELRSLHIEELSGVDSAASGYDGWLLTKATEPAKKLSDLSDEELASRIEDHERALSEKYSDELHDKLQALLDERDRRRQRPVAKSAQSWGQRLVQQGGKIIFR